MPPPKKKGAKKTGPKKPAEPSVWEPDDGQKLRDASDRALEFIGKTIFADGYAESNKDVANVFKAPWAFAYAGDAARASKAYALLEPFVPPKRNTLLPYPSENPAYKFAYPHYPCLWALQAAEALGKPTCALRNRVEDFHAVSGAGTTEDGDCDLFSTAMRLHVATTAKKKCANATADALTAAVVKNHGLDSFYLRWQGHEVITKPPPGSELPDLFYVVNKDAGDGLYFMLAFPALVLLEHGGSLRNKSAATTLLEFLESCGGIRTSPWAHKAAAAFAAAGRHATARAIALNFLASRPARPSDRMWIFRRDESQRRRGRDVDIPWGRVAAPPRLRGGYSAWPPPPPGDNTGPATSKNAGTARRTATRTTWKSSGASSGRARF